ncbi:MAG: hypothetical protein ACLTWO_14700 [Blautia massiliensis (ex Durand et al. 2017)]
MQQNRFRRKTAGHMPDAAGTVGNRQTGGTRCFVLVERHHRQKNDRDPCQYSHRQHRAKRGVSCIPHRQRPAGENAHPPAVCPSGVHDLGFPDPQRKRHAQPAEQGQQSRQVRAAKGIQHGGERAGPVPSLPGGSFFPVPQGRVRPS